MLRGISAWLTAERGPDNRDTLAALFALAQSLVTAQRPSEVVALLDTIFPPKPELGPDHADTQVSRDLRGELG